jgi:hypothetical protein
MPTPDVENCVAVLIGAAVAWVVSWLRRRAKGR